jgi:hypothetical protein
MKVISVFMMTVLLKFVSRVILHVNSAADPIQPNVNLVIIIRIELRPRFLVAANALMDLLS